VGDLVGAHPLHVPTRSGDRTQETIRRAYGVLVGIHQRSRATARNLDCESIDRSCTVCVPHPPGRTGSAEGHRACFAALSRENAMAISTGTDPVSAKPTVTFTLASNAGRGRIHDRLLQSLSSPATVLPDEAMMRVGFGYVRRASGIVSAMAPQTTRLSVSWWSSPSAAIGASGWRGGRGSVGIGRVTRVARPRWAGCSRSGYSVMG
jgi:hypothetical protein